MFTPIRLLAWKAANAAESSSRGGGGGGGGGRAEFHGVRSPHSAAMPAVIPGRTLTLTSPLRGWRAQARTRTRRLEVLPFGRAAGLEVSPTHPVWSGSIAREGGRCSVGGCSWAVVERSRGGVGGEGRKR